MADLDDFFAKKDRKKSKSTKKFLTTEEVAKKLEDNAKKVEKVKKERPIVEDEETNAPVQEQDEWRDFVEEKKDYTGLKIGNLTLNANAETNTPTEQNVEQQDESDSGQEVDKKMGPWRKIESNEVPEEPKVEKKIMQQQPNVQGGHYVPPNLRGASIQTPVQASRLKNMPAPDIHNEESFPNLARSGDFKKNRNEGSFEVVSHNKSASYRQTEQLKRTSTQGPKLSLENRYKTLSNDS